MPEAHELLRRDPLYGDAIALSADALRAEATADVLDRMPNGNGGARRAEAERLRRASDLCLLVGSLSDAVLDGIASGAIQRWLNDVREADKRRRSARGAR